MEISQLSPEEQSEFLADLGISEPARDRFVQAAYRLLNLISFLTAGEDECRAWPIPRGTTAHRAAGFEACGRLLDEAKRRLPIWKRQVFADGSEEWVGSA